MSKTLALVAAISLVLCVAFLGAARWIGGDAIFHDPHALGGLRPLIDMATRKEWRWAGGDTLAVDAPMTLHYLPQGKPNVTITGPAEAVEHVHFREGRIGSDAVSPKGLKAVVSGVAIRKFLVNNGETLELGHVDQPDLEIHINSNGTVRGDGKVGRLKLTINGSGNAELGGLSVGDATVTLFGSGNATLSPHGAVTLIAAGSGRLTLLTRPRSIDRKVLGSATIVEGSAPPSPPAPPPPPPPATPMAAPVPSGGSVISGDNVMANDNNDLDLGHIDQRRLNITVSASGAVKAEGKVDELSVRALASGPVHLGKLVARKAVVVLAGSADVTIAPTQDAQITILGSGNVHLLTRPATVSRTIVGSGHIIMDEK